MNLSELSRLQQKNQRFDVTTLLERVEYPVACKSNSVKKSCYLVEASGARGAQLKTEQRRTNFSAKINAASAKRTATHKTATLTKL